MNEKNGENEKGIDSDEEDYEIYFLQPASSPYNMQEKLKEANKALLDDNTIGDDRPLRIQFREELVDYEPDLTDDDVQSIESYNEVDYVVEQEFIEEAVPRQTVNKIALNIFTPSVNINEEDDDGEDLNSSDDDTENNENIKDRVVSNTNPPITTDEREDTLSDENVDEIEERIESDIDSYENNCLDENVSNRSSSLSDISISEEEIEDIQNVRQSDDTETKEETSTKSITSSSSKKTISVRSRKLSCVNCKSHCIERLDTQLDLTISKLQINEKPLCPALKLIKRKCCEKNRTKNEQKLPCYSGLRSEYGLTLHQLEKKQRREEVVRVREARRKQLMDEYKSRKIQQNEEIFSQWLKNLQKRKQEQTVKKKDGKKMISPKILNIPNKYSEGVERPKTCYSLMPSHNVKKLKRPNTSTACVFIQVPQNILKKGLHVGDIIVTRSKNVPSPKGLHILSIS